MKKERGGGGGKGRKGESINVHSMFMYTCTSKAHIPKAYISAQVLIVDSNGFERYMQLIAQTAQMWSTGWTMSRN